MLPLTQESLFQQVAAGGAVGLTFAAMERIYRPPGIAFVPVRDLFPATMVVAWRAEESRADVAAFVTAVCETAGHELPPPG